MGLSGPPIFLKIRSFHLSIIFLDSPVRVLNAWCRFNLDDGRLGAPVQTNLHKLARAPYARWGGATVNIHLLLPARLMLCWRWGWVG